MEISNGTYWSIKGQRKQIHKEENLISTAQRTSFFSVLSWNNSEFEKITLYLKSHTLALLKASWYLILVILEFRGLLNIIILNIF